MSVWISYYRADSRFASSQWETALLCNDISYWLGATLWSVLIIMFLFGCRLCIAHHTAFPKSVIYIILSHLQTWYLHDGMVSLIGVIEKPTTSMPWNPLNSRISSVFYRLWFIIFNPNQRRWIEYTRLSWWHFMLWGVLSSSHATSHSESGVTILICLLILSHSHCREQPG